MNSREINSKQLLRLADASLNRLAEGLRYLEDVCRFALNDTGLNQRLKNLRHQFTVTGWENRKALIDARDATGDVGTNLEAAVDKEVPRDLLATLAANSRRAQEALRSLEEVSKVTLFMPKLLPANIQQARFEMYSIEKEMLGKLCRRDKAERINGLYVVIDTAALQGRSHSRVTELVIRGGTKIIQLRNKKMDRGQLLPIAREMKEICEKNGALFMINDYVDLALAVKADGVHLGQTDLPVKVVRQMIPIDMLIGCSVTSVKEAKQAQADGADYLAVSGVYPTASKENIKPLGTSLIKRIKQATDLPLAAIGGIKLEHIKELKSLGIDAVAVISAVLGAKSPEAAARQMSKKFEEK